MAFHEFKGWKHGPADATHFSVQDVMTPWLKVDNGGVYFTTGLLWTKYLHEFDWERHLVGAIVKKPAVAPVKKPAVAPLGIEVINGIEVDWGEAPEGTTHVAIVRGRFIGWRKYTPEMLCNWVVNAWAVSTAVPHFWLDINKHCIFEHPDVRGVKVQYQEVRPEQPKREEAEVVKVKKQVGWW